MVTHKRGGKFPLWLHPSGQWCKKHNGKNHYFGTDREAALKRYVVEWDDRKVGRDPRLKRGQLVTVAELANHFLTRQRTRIAGGKLSARTWGEYHSVCERIVGAFGRDRAVGDLRPTDFGTLRAKAAEKLGPVSLAKFVTMAKTVFTFGFKSELIDVAIRYGDEFQKPDRKEIRLQRHRRGERLISAPDLWKLIDAADPQLHAMILLGLNCAYGQQDCSNLERSYLTTRPGWLNAPRQKTGIGRKAPLWPETQQALAEVEKMRPSPRDPADADAVFITKYGHRFLRYVDRGDDRRGMALDAVAQAFRKLCKKTGVVVNGGPYTLRHVFRTVADEMVPLDPPAIGLVMGHNDDTMSDAYRERIKPERLQAVVDHVRAWLLAGRAVEGKAGDVLPFKTAAAG